MLYIFHATVKYTQISLPVIYDNLSYMLYSSTELVTPWRWPWCMAYTCRSCL